MNLIKVIKVLLFMTFFLGVSIPAMARTISHPNHYDHATIGEHFDPYSMVTKMTDQDMIEWKKNLFGVMNTLMAQFAVS